MNIAKHISFFYIQDRIKYVNRIIDECNTYKIRTDIFIHTNSQDITISSFNAYHNGILRIIIHDLSNIHPYFLTWKCRDLMKQQKDDYDIFIYIEDDILVPFKAINYWLDYNKTIIEKNYNLGFVRIEVNNNEEYITDLYDEKFDTIINIDGNDYCVNNKNPYCAFWVYDKNTFNKFINSHYYDINNIHGYDIREKSAIGLHGMHTSFFISTVIPLENNKLIDGCKIYHLPNNYVNNISTCFAKIKFDEAI